jgi:RNA polymerase sigma-70 factor (ECF subfamily)
MVRPRAVRLGPESEEVPISRPRPLSETPDAELVGRARAGEPWAEEALFRKHVDYIAALSYRLLRNHAETDDVVQETFVAALTQLRDLAMPNALRPWLAGIAVHKIHRRFRRQRLLSVLGMHRSTDEATLEACAPSSTSPEIRAELALLDIALARVAELDRAAWVLRYVEGYSLEEVATLCSCSLATSKRRILRAHTSVRTHVDVQIDTEGSDS